MIIGVDKLEQDYHVIRLDKKTDVETINLQLEDILQEEVRTMTKKEYQLYMTQFYHKGSKGNHMTGAGMSTQQNFHVTIDKAYGILGFVKFLKGYYLIMITQKKKVVKIGQHNIYQIKEMKMVPLFKWVSNMRK